MHRRRCTVGQRAQTLHKPALGYSALLGDGSASANAATVVVPGRLLDPFHTAGAEQALPRRGPSGGPTADGSRDGGVGVAMRSY